MTNRKSTIRDVAKAAGVSIATVSYVLKGTGRVSESTIKRVWKVVNELNYTPNPYAQKLFARESAERENTGLIMNVCYWPSSSPIDISIQKDILYHFDSACKKNGYTGMNYSYRDRKGFFCKPVVNGLVDGVVLCTAHRDIIETMSRRVPAVVFWSEADPDQVKIPVISMALEDGYCNVFRQLKEYGIVGNAAFLEGYEPVYEEKPESLARSHRRYWQNAAEKCGLRAYPDHFMRVPTTSDTGVRDSLAIAEKIKTMVFEQGVRILCVEKFDCYILSSVLREQGIRIPEDLVIVRGDGETVDAQYVTRRESGGVVKLYVDLSAVFQKSVEVLERVIRGETVEKQYFLPFKDELYIPHEITGM